MSAAEHAEPWPYPGNIDPWAGPVDPDAAAAYLDRQAADRATRTRHHDTGECGCWAPDCDECAHRLGDGKRPRPGARRRFTRATTF